MTADLQPLSPEWWVAFHSRVPRPEVNGIADAFFPDKESAKTLQTLLDCQNILVVGGLPAFGPSAYVDPDEVAESLDESADEEHTYNKRVDIGRTVEYFLDAQYRYAGARVYHASAIDYEEIVKESRSVANRTGFCEEVPEDDLFERAKCLFAVDGSCHAADVIGLSRAKTAARI